MPPTAATVAAQRAAGVPWHGGQDLRVYVQVTLHAPQVGLHAWEKNKISVFLLVCILTSLVPATLMSLKPTNPRALMSTIGVACTS